MAQLNWMLAVLLPLFYLASQTLSNPIQNPAISGYTGLSGGGTSGSTGGSATVVDPEDFSAIKTVATIGDSYAAGIGAGLRTDWTCSRYDHSYPALLASYEGLENAKFQFLACSGALSTDVLAKQVPAINGIVDMMTVSAGGNDVGLVDILNDCIFGWKIVGYSSDGCDKTLANSQKLIDTELPGALDKLLTAAKAKLNPTSGRIYYTAYAQFFGSGSQCDSVYWNFFPLDPYAQALTTARRTQMNTLASNVNNVIKAAVARAGPQVVYVDYDGYYTDFNGRFCEPDVTEPAPDRDDLLFFERKTTNPALDWKEKRQLSGVTYDTVRPTASVNSVATPQANTAAPQAYTTAPVPSGVIATPIATQSAAIAAAEAEPDNIVAKGTFEGSIAAMLASTLATNPSWVGALSDGVFEELEVATPPTDGSAPKIMSVVSPSSNITASKFRRHAVDRRGGVGDFAAWLVADSVKRVFHPRPRGHSLMASLVLYHMEAQNAIMHPAPDYAANATTVWTELGPALSCPLQAADIPFAKLNP